jgi:DNA polymerase-3 subunit epsilon
MSSLSKSVEIFRDLYKRDNVIISGVEKSSLSHGCNVKVLYDPLSALLKLQSCRQGGKIFIDNSDIIKKVKLDKFNVYTMDTHRYIEICLDLYKQNLKVHDLPPHHGSYGNYSKFITEGFYETSFAYLFNYYSMLFNNPYIHTKICKDGKLIFQYLDSNYKRITIEASTVWKSAYYGYSHKRNKEICIGYILHTIGLMEQDETSRKEYISLCLERNNYLQGGKKYLQGGKKVKKKTKAKNISPIRNYSSTSSVKEKKQNEVISFVGIDFETANAKRTSPCSIGLVKVVDNIIVDAFYSLIDPETDEWTEIAYNIHGIAPEHVMGWPNFEKIWNESIAPFIDGADFLVGHNVKSMEMNVINQCSDRYNMSRPDIKYRCSMKLAKQVYSLKPAGLGPVCKVFGIDLSHHNALSDALASARLVVNYNKDYASGKRFGKYELSDEENKIIDSHMFDLRSKTIEEKRKSFIHDRQSENDAEIVEVDPIEESLIQQHMDSIKEEILTAKTVDGKQKFDDDEIDLFDY